MREQDSFLLKTIPNFKGLKNITTQIMCSTSGSPSRLLLKNEPDIQPNFFRSCNTSYYVSCLEFVYVHSTPSSYPMSLVLTKSNSANKNKTKRLQGRLQDVGIRCKCSIHRHKPWCMSFQIQQWLVHISDFNERDIGNLLRYPFKHLVCSLLIWKGNNGSLQRMNFSPYGSITNYENFNPKRMVIQIYRRDELEG
jgi:hypothetical protein